MTMTFMADLLGEHAEGVPAIVPEQFAVTGNDGRNLLGLLGRAIPIMLGLQKQGSSPLSALASAAHFLDMACRTVVADTGRTADQVAMVANTNVTSYVRVVEGGACSRCIVLAGREYGVSSGFLRHPRCDCTMEPVTRTHKPKPTSPETVVNGMSAAEREKTFGADGAKAIANGADIARVVNARRAMDTVTMFGRKVEVTYEGTGRGNKRKPPRLMPAEIFRQADDREHAIRLLKRNGYIY
ncbi:hypothetical protein ACWEQ3_01545 [Streptomyces mirabilis]